MTKIEWTHRPGTKGETWNPIRACNKETGGGGHFCEHVSEGCRNCYAEAWQKRFKNPIRFAAQDRDKVEIFLDEKVLTQPLRWRKPRTIFVCSMTDMYGAWVPDHWIDRIKAIEALCPQHVFIELTKRPERMRDYLGACERRVAILVVASDRKYGWQTRHDANGETVGFDRRCWPLPNVWAGTSVEDQKSADERIPLLLDTSAAVRWVSHEPALSPADFRVINAKHRTRGSVFSDAFDALSGNYVMKRDGGEWYSGLEGDENSESSKGLYPRLDQIIIGGESGPHARPMHPDWARSVRDQCRAAGVPFFFKQWGAWGQGVRCSHPRAATHRFDDGILMSLMGKKAAGRLLDGREWNEWPEGQGSGIRDQGQETEPRSPMPGT